MFSSETFNERDGIFEFRFRVVPLLPLSFAVFRNRRMLRRENGDASLAFEQGFLMRAAASTENNSLSRNEFAGQRGHGQRRIRSFAGPGMLDVRANDYTTQEPRDHRLERLWSNNLLAGPGQ